MMGLVVLEDILEEIVGEFTSNLAETDEDIFPQQDGTFIIAGSAHVREINKSLEWELPTDGPKTISGLVLEHLESFPDANAGLGPRWLWSVSRTGAACHETQRWRHRAGVARVCAADPSHSDGTGAA